MDELKIVAAVLTLASPKDGSFLPEQIVSRYKQIYAELQKPSTKTPISISPEVLDRSRRP